MSRQTLILAVLVGSVVAGLSGQAPTQPSTPAFEVASIKPTQTGPESALWRFRNERFTARYVTLKALIQSAYGKPEKVLTAQQVEGGPEWLDKDRFDVEATAPGTPDSPRGSFDATVLAMLQNLLEQRFSLKAHIVTREYPMVALVLAKQDGTLGPNLQRRTVPCTPAAAGSPTGDRQSQTCGGRVNPAGMLSGTGLTMTNLVSALSSLVPGLDRIVVDRTGLTGTFDIDLQWTPDIPLPGGSGVPGAGSTAPSLFTALEEQLGLKIESARGPVEVLVIDSVERPAPD